MSQKLPDTSMKNPPGSIGNQIFYDSDVKGFMYRVFILNYRTHAGSERRPTNGWFLD